VAVTALIRDRASHAALKRIVTTATDTAAHVHASGVMRHGAMADEIVVTVDIDPEYHINANPASFDYLIATTLRIPGAGATGVRYPGAVLLKTKFAPEGLSVYSGRVQLTAQLAKGVFAQVQAVRGTIEAQACTQTVCLSPSTIPVVIEVGGNGH
jgi:hypothetical protein